MAKVRNVSGVDLYVPEIGRVVEADEIVTVPGDRAEAYTCQPRTWVREDKKEG